MLDLNLGSKYETIISELVNTFKTLLESSLYQPPWGKYHDVDLVSTGNLPPLNICMSIFSFILLFFFFIVVQLQLSHFFPTLLSPASPRPVNPHPVVCAHEPSIHVSWLASSPSFPCYPPSPTRLVTGSVFFTSMSLVLSSLFVCFVD